MKMELKVKEEPNSEHEFEALNSSTLVGNSFNREIRKQEYHYKEELNIEWDEKDNDHAEQESTFNNISHCATVKLETADVSQTLRSKLMKTHTPNKKPNALPKLIKRCCPKCNNHNEITTSCLYRKQKCTTCSTNSLIFQCVKCNKRYTNYDSIRYHLVTKCNPGEYQQCLNCPYKTRIQSQLAKHVKRVHEKDNRLKCKCTICGREFKYAYSLNRHRRKSCGMKFPKTFVECENCDRKFKDKRYLKEHEKVCQQQMKMSCDFCKFESKYKSRLILHIKKLHSES